MPGYLREGLERGETSRSLKERPVYLRGRPRPLSEALVFQREAWVSQKEVYDEVYDNHRPEFAAHMTVQYKKLQYKYIHYSSTTPFKPHVVNNKLLQNYFYPTYCSAIQFGKR